MWRISAGLFLWIVGIGVGADPDLTGYRKVADAIPAKEIKVANIVDRVGFLGIDIEQQGPNWLVAEVVAGSPADKVGLKVNDRLEQIDGMPASEQVLAKAISGGPDTILKLRWQRDGKTMTGSATLVPLSSPIPVGTPRATLGLQVASVKDGEGVVIEQVAPGSVAERARLQPGEVLLKIDDVDLSTPDTLKEALAKKKPDDQVTLGLLLAQKRVEMKVRLDAEGQGDRGRRGGFDGRILRYWTKPLYRVGIILIDYPDAKHNPKVLAKSWEDALLSRDKYKVSPTGQTTYGSMADYYHEQSYGKLKIEGKAFEHVVVTKKRAEYDGGQRHALLREAMDLVIARDGKDAFKDIDGVFFIYSGGRYPAARGSLYWPHRSSFQHDGKSWPYFICGDGGERMGNISVFAHEFGHMLGLPDLYARPENPGMEGVGIWCAMANQAGNGRPQHFSAWSKEKLGWIKPTVIDPTVKQKLILSPIFDSPTECIKVPVRPDGSEYFLLENRAKKGFDVSLPADGLLIWRVIGNRPVLEESHGVDGPQGPRMFPNAVPFPSPANDSFTPFTTPSSRSQLGGGASVFITNIRRLPDGRVTLHVGYDYQ